MSHIFTVNEFSGHKSFVKPQDKKVFNVKNTKNSSGNFKDYYIMQFHNIQS